MSVNFYLVVASWVYSPLQVHIKLNIEDLTGFGQEVGTCSLLQPVKLKSYISHATGWSELNSTDSNFHHKSYNSRNTLVLR